MLKTAGRARARLSTRHRGQHLQKTTPRKHLENAFFRDVSRDASLGRTSVYVATRASGQTPMWSCPALDWEGLDLFMSSDAGVLPCAVSYDIVWFRQMEGARGAGQGVERR
jgi:hypothetical protein